MKKLYRIAFAALLAALVYPLQASAGSCSANQTCSNGSTVSCNGSSSCTVGSTSVTCDGFTTSCPSGGSCNASLECPYPYQPWFLSCSTSNGTCSQTSTSVTCGSVTKRCSDCVNASPACPL